MAKAKNPKDPVVEPVADAIVETPVEDTVELVVAPEATVEVVEAETDTQAATIAEDTVDAAPVPTEAEVETKDEEVNAEDEVAEVEVPANSSFLVFPTDIWGVTKDIKAAVIAAASRVNGDIEKKELVDATLKICLGHLNSKFKVDAEARAKLVAESDGN